MEHVSESEWAEYLQRHAAAIHRNGWTIEHVEQDEWFPKFSYTAGLAQRDLPELIVVGTQFPVGLHILNELASRLLQGETFEDRQQVQKVLKDFPVELRAISQEAAHEFLRIAGVFAQRDKWNAFQVVWPDPDGHFPWEPEFDTRWVSTQPIFQSKAEAEAVCQTRH